MGDYIPEYRGPRRKGKAPASWFLFDQIITWAIGLSAAYLPLALAKENLIPDAFAQYINGDVLRFVSALIGFCCILFRYNGMGKREQKIELKLSPANSLIRYFTAKFFHLNFRELYTIEEIEKHGQTLED